MIAFVKGKIEFLAVDYCIIDNNGLGYRVFMPAPQLSRLTLGQEVKAYTYMAVRDDAIHLYGFLSREYYQLFMQLITVSGIGPKVALGILAGAKVDEFYLAVQSRDLKFLTKLPGIGKKTAERMLLELKDKLGTLDGADLEFSDSTGTTTGTVLDEAIESLVALGYNNSEIIPTIKKIEGRESMSTEDVIRQALKLMAGRN